MPMTVRRFLAAVAVAIGLFAFAPHASADTLCQQLTIPPIGFVSPDICLPVVP
jgi:hypothetical protein